MDIATLAAWGEFLGGVAVVVSLVYLAWQIRQNSKLLSASTSSATSQILHSNSVLMAQDPELARIYWAGIRDRASLSEPDRQRFDPLLAVMFQGNQQQYEFACEGLGLPMSAEYQENVMRWTMQQPGVQAWWREWGVSYTREFRDWIDSLIRERKAAV